MRGEHWPRATRRQPCSICGRPDWCQTSLDGAIVKCMRVASGSFQTVTDGTGEGHLHRLDDHLHRGSGRSPCSAADVERIATPRMRDAVYGAILHRLTLSPAHVANLLGRGLDEGTIVRSQYATCASPCLMSEVVADLAQRLDLTGVPGLRRRADRWTVEADEGDLLVPVRNAGWQIAALIRRTNSAEKRYRWLSDGKPSCGSPPHHAEPWNVEFRRALYITEGALKADVIAAKLGFTTIGLAGCASIPSGFSVTLREEYPTVRSVFVAFDADVQTNPNVARGRDRLTRNLRTAGYYVHLVEWDVNGGKGLDDVLSGAVG
jgi:hypothetical protein